MFLRLEDYGIPVIMFTQVQHGLPFSEDSHAHIYVDDQAVLCGLGAACSHWSTPRLWECSMHQTVQRNGLYSL